MRLSLRCRTRATCRGLVGWFFFAQAIASAWVPGVASGVLVWAGSTVKPVAFSLMNRLSATLWFPDDAGDAARQAALF